MCESMRRYCKHGSSPEQGPTPPNVETLIKEAERLRVENIVRSSANLPMLRLTSLFNFNEFERGSLLLALAPELDLRYEILCSYLNNDVTGRRPTCDLALRLFSANTSWPEFGDGDGTDVDSLANQFVLTAGQIRDAVQSARDDLRLRERAGTLPSTPDLFAAARVQSQRELRSLAQCIGPVYSWDELVPRIGSPRLNFAGYTWRADQADAHCEFLVRSDLAKTRPAILQSKASVMEPSPSRLIYHVKPEINSAFLWIRLVPESADEQQAQI
jgi:hypothetical protein